MAAGKPFICDMCPPPRFGEAPKTFDAGGLAVHQGKCHNPLKRAYEEEIQKFHAEGKALRAEAASAQSALNECRELAKSAAVGLSSKALMGFAHVHFDHRATIGACDATKLLFSQLIDQRDEAIIRIMKKNPDLTACDMKEIMKELNQGFEMLRDHRAEEKMRHLTLRDAWVEPSVRDLLPTATTTGKLPDGRPMRKHVPYCVSMPLKDMLQRMFKWDSHAYQDLKASYERIYSNEVTRQNGAEVNIRDVLDGMIVANDPWTVAFLQSSGKTWGSNGQLIKTRDSDCHPLYLWFNWDELSTNNPLGAFQKESKFMMCYCVLLNLDPSRRLSFPYLMVHTVARHEDIVHPDIGFDKIIGAGDTIDSPGHSWTSDMLRLNKGYYLEAVQTDPKDPTSTRRLFVTGGHSIGTADKPAAALAAGRKESVGPTTERICHACDAGQGPVSLACANCKKSERQCSCEGGFYCTHYRQASSFKCVKCSRIAPLCNCTSEDGSRVLPTTKPYTLLTKGQWLAQKKQDEQLLDPKAKALFRRSIGVNTFDTVFRDVPGSDQYAPGGRVPGDPMHVAAEGGGKVWGGCVIWYITAKLKLCGVADINTSSRTYAWPKFHAFARPPQLPESLSESTKDECGLQVPHLDAALKMNAGAVITWVLHSIPVLLGVKQISHYLLEYRDRHGEYPLFWQEWICYVRIFRLSLSRVTNNFWAIKIADLSQEHKKLVLMIPEYVQMFKKKEHALDHFAVDGIMVGPLVSFWNFLLEGFHQPHKRSAEASNHKATMLTMVGNWAERSALAFFDPKHRDDSDVKLIRSAQFVETVDTASVQSVLMRRLVTVADLSGHHDIKVEWFECVEHKGRAFGQGSWLEVTFHQGQGVHLNARLSKVHALLRVNDDKVFVALNIYPPDSLKMNEDDDLYCDRGDVERNETSNECTSAVLPVGKDLTVDVLWRLDYDKTGGVLPKCSFLRI